MNKNDAKNIKNILSSIARDPRYAGKMDEKRIEKTWRETNAPFVVERTQKVLYRDGQLILYITSAPLKQELFNSRPQIIEKMRKALPEIEIEEVIIR